MRKATEEAEAIRSEARSAADELQAEADAEAAEARRAVEEEVARRREEGRAGLLSEINELEGIRDSLASDVIVLERHVDEQREVVQAAIGELQSLLDHPEAFRIAMAPGVVDRPRPAAGPRRRGARHRGPPGRGRRRPAPRRPDEPADRPPDPEPEPDPGPTSEPATDDLQVGPPPVPPSTDGPAAPAAPVVDPPPPSTPDALAFPAEPAPVDPAPAEGARPPSAGGRRGRPHRSTRSC